MSNDQVRTVDKDIKTGLWQNNLDGSYIKVRSIGLTVIRYNDEGCEGVYDMGVSELLNSYQLRESDNSSPAVDDTFNDDTPAQTFGDIGSRLAAINFNPSGKRRGIAPVMWDEGKDDKAVTCDFFSLSDDDSGYEIPIGSVWQYMAGSTLEVVTDRGSNWVATRYLRDHFVRNSTQTLKQFRECYKLIYTPGEECDQ